jgi:hypothetical protein
LVFVIIIILIYLKGRKGGKLRGAKGWRLVEVVFDVMAVS